jgi:hypothetical protein
MRDRFTSGLPRSGYLPSQPRRGGPAGVSRPAAESDVPSGEDPHEIDQDRQRTGTAHEDRYGPEPSASEQVGGQHLNTVSRLENEGGRLSAQERWALWGKTVVLIINEMSQLASRLLVKNRDLPVWLRFVFIAPILVVGLALLRRGLLGATAAHDVIAGLRNLAQLDGIPGP